MAIQTTLVGESTLKKPIIPARSAINWYFFLMSPGNVLRDEEGYDENAC